MIETLVGDAIIHGIRSSGAQTTGYTSIAISQGGVAYYASFILDRMEATDMADKYKLKNEIGFDITGAAFNQRAEITVDLTPAASSRQALAAIPSFPMIFSKITLTNVFITGTLEGTATQIFNGDYLYEGDARILQQNGQPVKLTGLKLTKYADGGQNGIMTSVVAG